MLAMGDVIEHLPVGKEQISEGLTPASLTPPKTSTSSFEIAATE